VGVRRWSKGAAREAGWGLNAFEFEQAYYSAYGHSHPVSFMKADEQGTLVNTIRMGGRRIAPGGRQHIRAEA